MRRPVFSTSATVSARSSLVAGMFFAVSTARQTSMVMMSAPYSAKAHAVGPPLPAGPTGDERDLALDHPSHGSPCDSCPERRLVDTSER